MFHVSQKIFVIPQQGWELLVNLQGGLNCIVSEKKEHRSMNKIVPQGLVLLETGRYIYDDEILKKYMGHIKI